MVWLRVKSGIRWLVESIFLRERFRLPSVRNDGRDNCSGTGTGHEMSSRNMWVLHGTSVKTLTDVCMHDEPPAALELCPSDGLFGSCPAACKTEAVRIWAKHPNIAQCEA